MPSFRSLHPQSVKWRAASAVILLLALVSLLVDPSAVRLLGGVLRQTGLGDDRIQHGILGLVVAGVLAVWLWFESERPSASIAAVSILAIGVGGVVESVQPAFDRTPELSDWTAHSAGAVLGTLAAGIFFALLQRQRAARHVRATVFRGRVDHRQLRGRSTPEARAESGRPPEDQHPRA